MRGITHDANSSRCHDRESPSWLAGELFDQPVVSRSLFVSVAT